MYFLASSTAAAIPPPTFQDVLDRVYRDHRRTAARRQVSVLAVLRFCSLADCTPRSLRAEPSALRAAFARIHPSKHDLSSKKWRRFKATVFAAAQRTTTVHSVSRLSPAWENLRNRLPRTLFHSGLSHFARFCSQRAICPANVNEAVMDTFHSYLVRETFVVDPNEMHRLICSLWNKACAALLPAEILQVTLPNYRKRRRLTFADFPETFRADVDRYLFMRATTSNTCRLNSILNPLKPGTIRLRREQLRMAAATLVSRGREAASIRTLSDLVEPQAFKEIMRRFVDEEKSPTWITGVAKTLIAVAREWTPVSAAQTAELKRLFSFLPRPRKGLTLKNRDMLRQLNDASTLRSLLTLPQQLFAEARLVDPPTVSQAIQAQLAVAIEFLLICPVRAQI